MKLLVCGGRDYGNKAYMFKLLDELLTHFKYLFIINGDAPGADTLASEWALGCGQPLAKVPANWAVHGKGAGPIRNASMLLLSPDFVLAFPGGWGTANKIGRAHV